MTRNNSVAFRQIMAQLAEILERWDSGKGKPYKGQLIDWSAYEADKADIEIQGARIMREKGQAFYFLPLFGFADPESIPTLPANYGQPA